MTDDLISRKYVLDALAIFDRSHAEDPKSIDKFMHGIESAREIVQNAPTVDAEPVRRGTWNKLQELDNVTCSACGWLQLLRTNYCPNCGAKMEVQNENNRR